LFWSSKFSPKDQLSANSALRSSLIVFFGLTVIKESPFVSTVPATISEDIPLGASRAWKAKEEDSAIQQELSKTGIVGMTRIIPNLLKK
jgi:hypothetical protein